MVAAGEPVFVSDILKAIRASSERPLVRLIAAAVQSIPDNVLTALQFPAGDLLDTHNFHDPVTNNSRITPTIAAWYRFTGCYVSAAMTTPASHTAYFRRNGSVAIAPGPRNAGFTITHGNMVSALIQCNGLGDYVELMAQQDSAGAVNTAVSSQLASTFECELVRYL